MQPKDVLVWGLQYAGQLEGSAAVIRELCHALETARRFSRPAVLAANINELRLTGRTANALHEEGVTIVEEVVRYSAKELMQLRCFGAGCLKELREKLAEHGLRLNGD